MFHRAFPGGAEAGDGLRALWRWSFLGLSSRFTGWAQTATVLGSDASPAPVTSAVLDPHGVATDIVGNIYVADTGNRRVIQVAPSTMGYNAATTLVSASTMGATFKPASVAVDGFTNVYIADAGSGTVVELPWNNTGYGAPVTVFSGTSLVSPAYVAVDGNRICT